MKKIAFAGLLPVLLSGCVSTLPPETFTHRSPADAHQEIRESSYHNIMSGFEPREPVEPKSWRRNNDDSAPKAGARS